MSLLLDPRDPVEHVIEDVTFRVRVLTSREFLRLIPHITALESMVDEEGDVELTGDLVEHMEEVLRVGLCPLDPEKDGTIPDEDLDRIPPNVWGPLWTKVLEVNTINGDDRKN